MTESAGPSVSAPLLPDAAPPAARAWFRWPFGRLRAPAYYRAIALRVLSGLYHDGFIHAGNLAYITLIALFPFFIVATAIMSLFGQTDEGIRTFGTILSLMPARVADVLSGPMQEVVNARSGGLVWIGGLVGLWTVGSLIETVRDILRRAYGVRSNRSFFEYRLGAIGIIFVAVLLMMLSFSLQVVLTGADQFVAHLAPGLGVLLHKIGWYRAIPVAGLFFALYMIFYALTPRRFKSRAYPKWPGPLLTTGWWLATTGLLPLALRSVLSYDITYGSLAGVMITLFFFYIVGLGLVAGAELNAAVAEPGRRRFRPEGEDDDPAMDEKG